MRIYLIRHAQTQGNLKHRYIGRTDEPLCEIGLDTARGITPPQVDIIFRSPMLRCKQTADILYPDKQKIVVDDLRECDFGDFEGKTADELVCDTHYLNWVNGGCKEIIPNGESVDGFKNRCCEAFQKIATEHKDDKNSICFVVHGGIIMAILERFDIRKKNFYDYFIENCGIIECYAEFDGGLKLRISGGVS
ncbi:MAG: histidine phosphatase family protein [Clostridiales bacterium]|jgi:alpha-ribazole phosphatase|nr:histidine phosphatase family protein [Clostridiales bacterium]